MKKWNVSSEEAEKLIKQHLRLCYDVCHFAIGYEPHQQMIEQLFSATDTSWKNSDQCGLKSKDG